MATSVDGVDIDSATTLPNGFYFDDLSKLRVIDPAVEQQTDSLRQECDAFVHDVDSFTSTVGGFVAYIDKLGQAVDAVKLKAIGAKNRLQTQSKAKETEKQQVLAMIAEQQATLARLQKQQASLERTVMEQERFIEDFVMQK